MHAIAIEIFEVCMFFAIAMEIEWLPRSQNDKADYLSRIVDLDDGHQVQPCFNSLTPVGVLIQLITLLLFTMHRCLDSIRNFGIRSLRSWKLLPKIGPGTTTGFVPLCH